MFPLSVWRANAPQSLPFRWVLYCFAPACCTGKKKVICGSKFCPSTQNDIAGKSFVIHPIPHFSPNSYFMDHSRYKPPQCSQSSRYSVTVILLLLFLLLLLLHPHPPKGNYFTMTSISSMRGIQQESQSPADNDECTTNAVRH